MKGFDNRDECHDLYSRVYSDSNLSASKKLPVLRDKCQTNAVAGVVLGRIRGRFTTFNTQHQNQGHQ
jgi:hypothetical protein